MKGEIVISDIIDVNSNALMEKDSDATQLWHVQVGGDKVGGSDPAGEKHTATSSNSGTTSTPTKSFFSFRSNAQTTPPVAKVSSVDEKLPRVNSRGGDGNGGVGDTGFYIKTASRLYVFQADSIVEAANWVVMLRKFITRKSTTQ